MAKSFKQLHDAMPTKSKLRAKLLFEDLLSSLPLAAIRKARGVTQKSVAQLLGVSQAAISRLESRTDFLVSTLQKYTSATGGELTIILKYNEESFCLEKSQSDCGYKLVQSINRRQNHPWGDALSATPGKRVRKQDVSSTVGNVHYMRNREAA